MAEEIKKLVKEYQEGRISRREFIQQAVVFTGSLAVATSLIDSLAFPQAYAAQVEPNDPSLTSGSAQFPGPAGTVLGYQSRPSAAGSYPAVIIIHANQGLDDHIRDVARRFAKVGYFALAPDYLSRKGGTEKFPDANKGLSMGGLAPKEVIKEDTESAVAYLRSLKEVRSDRIGITGFCWGGEQAFHAATQVRGLKAAVIFYGRSPNPLDLVQQIEAPVFVHYGELDKGITGGVPQTEEAMKKYNKPYEYKIYSNAQHAFFHDGRADRYNPEAAKEAWTRTVEFFKKHLQS